MIKAEWTNKDVLDLQPTCNQLATATEEQTAHYCNRYAVFCTGANERGECNTTACWNSKWLHELLRRGW